MRPAAAVAAQPGPFNEPSTACMGTCWAPEPPQQLLTPNSSFVQLPEPAPEQLGSTGGSRAARALLQEQRLQAQMDKEDRRVKELTEQLLYDFLPAALSAVLPPCEDPLKGLDAGRCRAVAAATLALSSLLNAPPGFLEFLLCIPWHELASLYPRRDCIDKLLARLQVSAEERRLLVNTRIDPLLVPVMMEFMYRECHVQSLPPTLQLAAPLSSRGSCTKEGAEAKGQMKEDGNHTAVEHANSKGCASSVGSSSTSSSSQEQNGVLQEAVAALLDGATPLHCAALRGNPAQVDHLLFCGADPTARTASGELPVELVPFCGDRDAVTGARMCRCMGWEDQQVWECRSRLARSLIARRCAMHFVGGAMAWLRLVLLCLLCLLGITRRVAVLERPALCQHIVARRRQKAADARARALALLQRLRSEAQQGRHFLQLARNGSRSPGRLKARSEGPATPAYAEQAAEPPSWRISTSSDAPTQQHDQRQEVAAAQKLQEHSSPQHPANAVQWQETPSPCSPTKQCQHQEQHVHQQHWQQQRLELLGTLVPATDSSHLVTEAGTVPTEPVAGEAKAASPVGTDEPAELAFRCFVRAVHALQGLELQGGCIPHLLVEHQPAGTADAAAPPTATTLSATGAVGHSYQQQQQQVQALHKGEQLLVLEDEQAELYCCWAESVLLKFRSCGCPGCAALAVQAIRMAHSQTARLFGQMEHQRAARPDRWRSVGIALGRALAAHMALLLDTDARSDPCRAAVWRAEQCLMEWERLVRAGLAADAPGHHGNAGSMIGAPMRFSNGSTGGAAGTAGAAVAGYGLGCRAGAADADVVVGVPVACVPVATAPTGALAWDSAAAGACRSGAERALALRLWVRTADADLTLAEALQGYQLQPNQTLQDALAGAVKYASPGDGASLSAAGSTDGTVGDSSAIQPGPCNGHAAERCSSLHAAEGAGGAGGRRPYLARAVSPGLLLQLEAAQGLALAASAPVRALVAAVAESAAAELAAAGKLRSIVGAKGPPTSPEGVQALSDAIAEASAFPRLQAEAEAAKELYHRCVGRSEAAGQLDAIMAEVRRATDGMAAALSSLTSSSSSSGGSSSASGGGSSGSASVLDAFDAAVWEGHMRLLEGAIEEAKDANIGVVQARRLLKELQARAAAAKAAQQLDKAMAKRPCGSAALRGVMTHAESASQSIAAVAGPSDVFAQLLPARLATARRRLEVERAAEALHRAAAQHRGVADLPKLEAAILSARKVGAEELDPAAYAKASDLRAKLTDAARARGVLESAVRALQRNGRPEDAESVEAALAAAESWGELLSGEVAKAKDALGAWRSQAASEAKLAKALASGVGSSALARAIQEAAAAGVKVVAARRTLKVLQSLEAAVGAAMLGLDAGPAAAAAHVGQLSSRVSAAEAGGVAAPLLASARQLLWQLSAIGAGEALEAALKPRSDWSVHQRIAALREALDNAEALLRSWEAAREAGASRNEEGDASAAASVAASVAPSEAASLEDGASAGNACDGDGASQAGGALQQQRQQEGGQQVPHSSESSFGARAGAADAAARAEEAVAAVVVLAARARELLEADQREHEEQERRRAEEERAKREQQEAERSARLQAEQERLEREKAERSERDKAAADKREAKAKADGKRGVKVVWAEVGGRNRSSPGGPREMAAILVRAGSDGAEAEAAAIAAAAAAASQVDERQAERQQQHDWQQQERQRQQQQQAEWAAEQERQVLAQQLAAQYPAFGADASAAAAAALAQVRAAHANLQQQQHQLAAMLQAQFGDAAAAAAAAASFADNLLHLPLTASQVSDAVRRSAAQHGRSSSLDILGEATTKLDREVLELLELGGSADGTGARLAGAQQPGQPQLPASQQQELQQWPPVSSLQLQQQQQLGQLPVSCGGAVWGRGGSEGGALLPPSANGGLPAWQLGSHGGFVPGTRSHSEGGDGAAVGGWAAGIGAQLGLAPDSLQSLGQVLSPQGHAAAGASALFGNGDGSSGPLIQAPSPVVPRTSSSGGSRFGYVDLGGASWGMDGSAGPGLGLRPLPLDGSAGTGLGLRPLPLDASPAAQSSSLVQGAGAAAGGGIQRKVWPPGVGLIGRVRTGRGAANLHGADAPVQPWQEAPGAGALRYSSGGGGSGDGSGGAALPSVVQYSGAAGDLAASTQHMLRASLPQPLSWGGVGGPGAGGMMQQQGSEAGPLCHFYQQGYCRDGDLCRFSHAVAGLGGRGSAAGAAANSGVVPLAAPAAGMQLAEQAGGGVFGNMHNRTAVGGFAFGAPGSDAFSPALLMRSSSGGSGGGGAGVVGHGSAAGHAAAAAAETNGMQCLGGGGSVGGGASSGRLASASSGASALMQLLPDEL